MKSRCVIAALSACALLGCVSEPRRTSKDSPDWSVRNVRFIGAPENPELAEKARRLGNAYYPEIFAALNDGTQEVPPFDIIFREDLARHYKLSVKRSTQNMPKMMNYYPSGVAAGGNIHLDTETFLREPGALDRILLHEMAHLAQRYNWYRRATMPYYWQEGIAEAMVFKLENVNVPRDRPCRCSAVWPHYMSGYSCAAAFLLYSENTYDPQLIARLNSALRHGSYTDDFFEESTGRPLQQLWSEFLLTSNVTPMAAKINRIYDELGYKNGRPPRDVKGRLRAHIAKQANGEAMIHLLDHADFDDRRITDLQALITTSVYFADVGGSIVAAKTLQNQNRLPGMARGEDGRIWEPSSIFDIDLQEQQSPHEIRASKKGDSSVYHYEFARECDSCSWILHKAWRTDEAGLVAENYPIEGH